jgi:ribonuclease J
MLVLMRLNEFAQIPQPEWKGGHMRAVVTRKMMDLMKRLGEPGLIEYLKKHSAAMSADKLPATPEKWVIMARSSLVDDYRRKGVVPTEEDTWVWSMWNGYLEQASTLPMREFFAPCQKAYIHSSGHASPTVLQKFAEAMRPKVLIPVHGEGWHTQAECFPNLRVVTDGEWLELGV